MDAASRAQSPWVATGRLKRLEATVVFFGISLIVLSVFVSTVYFGHLDGALTSQLQLSDAAGEIMRLDEVLTMSARMYTATHDGTYKQRYDEAVPLLDLQIATVKALAPQAADGITLTDEANKRLIAIEESSIRLCEQDRCTEGYALLHGTEYYERKEEYARGIKKALGNGQQELGDTSRSLVNGLRIIQIGSIINCLFVGIYLVRIRKRLAAQEVLMERGRVYRGTIDLLMDYFNNVLNRMGLFLVRVAESDHRVLPEDRNAMQKVIEEAALHLVDMSSVEGGEFPERAISRLSETPEQVNAVPVPAIVPVAFPTAPVHQTEVSPTTALKRILVVEDDPTSQTMLRKILEKRQCSVVVTNNGAEGLETLSQTNPQSCFAAVLMDIQMPVMDGITALQEIRAAGTWWSRVPVIAVTGQAAQGDRERLLAVGFDSYVAKPVNVSALMKEISLHTDRPSAQQCMDV